MKGERPPDGCGFVVRTSTDKKWCHDDTKSDAEIYQEVAGLSRNGRVG